MKNLYLVLIAGLLSACSSSDNFVSDSFHPRDAQFTETAQLIAQLRSEQITAVALHELTFQKLSLDSSNHINITANSPVVNFPEGNAFVAALFLPEHIGQFTFVLESPVGRTVLVPSVVFLNENLQQVSRIDNAQFNKKGFFSIEKAFSSKEAQAIRYILVYSKNSELDGKTEVVDVAREYELSKGRVLPETTKLYAQHSPIGRMNIRFKDVFFTAQSINQRPISDDTVSFKASPDVKAPTILSDTEAFYLQQISKALQQGNAVRAKRLVEEAQRAGSTKAQAHYMEALKKQQ